MILAQHHREKLPCGSSTWLGVHIAVAAAAIATAVSLAAPTVCVNPALLVFGLVGVVLCLTSDGLVLAGLLGGNIADPAALVAPSARL